MTQINIILNFIWDLIFHPITNQLFSIGVTAFMGWLAYYSYKISKSAQNANNLSLVKPMFNALQTMEVEAHRLVLGVYDKKSTDTPRVIARNYLEPQYWILLNELKYISLLKQPIKSRTGELTALINTFANAYHDRLLPINTIIGDVNETLRRERAHPSRGKTSIQRAAG